MVIGFDKVMKEMRTPSENWPIPEDAESGKSNRLCKTEGVSWTYDTPSVFYPFFKILRSLSNVFCDNVLAVEYASSSQRDNYPSPRLSELEIL